MPTLNILEVCNNCIVNLNGLKTCYLPMLEVFNFSTCLHVIGKKVIGWFHYNPLA